MKKFIFLLLAFFMIFGCKRKKPSLSGEDPVEFEDFIDSYPAVQLPFQLTDTALNKKENDSLLISSRIFSQFVSDTMLSGKFGKTGTPKIYPLAKIETDKDRKFIIAKMVLADKKAAYIIAFNNKGQFAGSMEFLRPDDDRTTRQVSSIDKQLSINKAVFRTNKDGIISDGRDVFGYSKDAGQFSLVMTDVLDENDVELINPIDTLSKKNKFSGDYLTDKKNIVSIRDGKKPGSFHFFVHLEKNSGDCTGELKGDAFFSNPNTAMYRTGGDPCVLQFLFTANSVTLKEIEGCGSRRELNCSFNGNYPRKKDLKPKSIKKKAIQK
jgi:hypothetical protein